MKLKKLEELLKNNTYPGRGIVVGKSADDKHAVVAYFIMGRSENSRNRVFEETNDGITTKAFDETKLSDPRLIIYRPIRKQGNTLVVTNGDQTDTVIEGFSQGKTFQEALRTRTFEPDAPNFTPRISAQIRFGAQFSYEMSLIKSDNGNPKSVLRYFYEYAQPQRGQGRFLHTYHSDGDPIPSFQGEPHAVEIAGDIECFTATLWENLNAENKVSLYTCYIELTGGKTRTKIVNKNK